MKKTILTILFVISSTLCLSQNDINSGNYYNYYSNGENLKGTKLTTFWLNKLEVSQILKEEMKNNGFEWLSDFRILKLDSINHVVSVCYSEKSKFGFLYESTHGMIPNVNNRKIKSMYKSMTGNDYSEKIVNINGQSDYIKIKEIPNNLIIIKEDCYWYQETDNNKDNKKLVTKEIIIEILREDIRQILSEVKK
ncbi:MAG TPA: hypothetical protein VK164_01885 [Flavobacterium sp.]|uniref:hypothetical protein n=1 Tax=Flavobacterium sp. TaxID=239 RepID=UPI002B4AE08D|nr:hypothetical protein [Flavobacterium sp.]HLO72662.1 hypothetical protein [Flavobacterium sp.]